MKKLDKYIVREENIETTKVVTDFHFVYILADYLNEQSSRRFKFNIDGKNVDIVGFNFDFTIHLNGEKICEVIDFVLYNENRTAMLYLNSLFQKNDIV